jgi:hypothetical protein
MVLRDHVEDSQANSEFSHHSTSLLARSPPYLLGMAPRAEWKTKRETNKLHNRAARHAAAAIEIAGAAV